MSPASRAQAHDRLADLVVELSGVDHANARNALDAALARNGDTGDQLLNIADAIITLRNGAAEVSAPISSDTEEIAPENGAAEDSCCC